MKNIRFKIGIFALFLSAVIITIVLITSNNSGLQIVVQIESPTMNDNGQPLQANELESFILTWTNDDGSVLGKDSIPGYEHQYIVKGLEPGKYLINVVSKTVYGTLSNPALLIKELYKQEAVE